ncbi:DNA-binding protein [Candidatus Woesearchaeota archaeon]|nr:DNA-binding protein [Candidatus Woesearchaeota archaeon]|tara:strand:- start:839 stop:1192 length:354 start_codon:yes stop_codon:yes gene_type:complete
MKISEVQPGQGNIDVEVEVVSLDEPRSFEKFGKQGRVCNATVKDDSGEIKLTLWNDDIDKVKAGMKIKLTNGYCNEFRGESQLTTGKFGKLEIEGEGGDAPADAPAEDAAEKPADEE